MELITYQPGNGPVSICGFSIVPGPGEERYVILHELPENPGIPAGSAPAVVLESLLDKYSPRIGKPPLDHVRWFVHLFGPEDGISDSFTEAAVEVRGNPVLGFEVRFLAWRDVDSAALRHLRRSLEWLGDDGVYGCFNID